jgi:hypothetical protein
MRFGFKVKWILPLNLKAMDDKTLPYEVYTTIKSCKENEEDYIFDEEVKYGSPRWGNNLLL